MVLVLLQRGADAGDVRDSVMHSESCVGEAVLESINRGMKTSEQRAGLVRLVTVDEGFECSAADISELPPVNAVGLEGQCAIRRWDQSWGQQFLTLEMPGHGIDVVVDTGGEHRIDALQYAPLTVGHDDEPALVDEACWKRFEGRIVEPEGSYDVGAWR